MFLSKELKIVDAITIAAGAAGSSAVNGAALDTANAESVLVEVKTGPIVSGAVTSIKWQEGDAANLSDAADVAGTSQTIADDADNQIFYINIEKPRKRYGRVVVSRATQNATVTATYFVGGNRVVPVTQGSGVQGETHVSPAIGTA